MASPEQHIEITDFSPGIHGDYHSASSPQFTSSDDLSGTTLANGAARIEGTDRCKVDKTGALVPLPKAQLTGTLDGIGPTYTLQPNREFRYILDAQTGQTLVDTTLAQPTPFTETRRLVHAMWGYWGDDNDDYHPVVIGREYRTWLDESETDSIFDFAVADAEGEATDGAPIAPLPIGQLSDARFYLGNTEYGAADEGHILFPRTFTNHNVVEVPDAAIFDATDELSIMAKIEPTIGGGGGTILSKWEETTQCSYQLRVIEDSTDPGTFTLRLEWSSTGADQLTQESDPFTIDAPKWVGVTLIGDNGAAGHDVAFWESDDGVIYLGENSLMNGTWTQIGSTITTASTTSMFASTAPVWIGSTTGIFGSDTFEDNYIGRIFSVFAGDTAFPSGPSVTGTMLWFAPEHIPPDEPGSMTRGSATFTIIKNEAPYPSFVTPPGTAFKPSWMYPVTVALLATPWPNWGAGNKLRQTTLDSTLRAQLGLAPAVTRDFTNFSPGIGGDGIGTCAIGMSWHNPAIGAAPQATVDESYWYFHYNERGNVFETGQIEGGPINPYLLVAHQGRIVMADRRRTRQTMRLHSDDAFGVTDDLLWYSDYGLPCQDFDLVSESFGGSVGYGSHDVYPVSSMDPYNKLLVAEDDVSQIGTIGVTTVDQLLVVKHHTGGAMISGDLDRPSVRRLPFIESTGGVVCKGANTPIGFVYGSNNGIFTWQGGDSTVKLSNQIDGFFWDHTNGSDEETYAGSRGRMAYWNGLVCVPNNYVFDIDSQSWWRFAVPTLEPIATDTAAYNCYDRDEEGTLYAFPYRNKWPTDATDPLPVWHTFDQRVLDSEYNWHSHPLLETRGRTQSFQTIELLTTARGEATITVTLEGFDKQGGQTFERTTTFAVEDATEPQLLRKDLTPNFTAEYVSVRINAASIDTDLPAPKLHGIRFGIKERATVPRAG